MDAFDCIKSKLDIREFSKEEVPEEIILKVLQAARLSGTGLNTQHWRFILIKNKQNLENLAKDSTSGNWVSRCNFARFCSIKMHTLRTFFHRLGGLPLETNRIPLPLLHLKDILND